MRGRLVVVVWTGVLSVGCQAVEGDVPPDDGRRTTVIRWSSAVSGPDIVTVGGPAAAAPRCFRTIFPVQANVNTDVVPPAFNGYSDFPPETYAAIEALFTDEVDTVLRGDSDRLRSRPAGAVRLGDFLDLEHVPVVRGTPLAVRLPLDQTASDVTLELLGKLLPLIDGHCPHP
jgi:hypothetical protein